MSSEVGEVNVRGKIRGTVCVRENMHVRESKCGGEGVWK